MGAEVMYEKFTTWADVLAFVDRGGWLHYHAPMDLRPISVLVVKRFKNGKLRLRALDLTFTTDSGHLDRFRRTA
jgi:hypothetical protein